MLIESWILKKDQIINNGYIKMVNYKLFKELGVRESLGAKGNGLFVLIVNI
jgi:hypothetical protein